jgi:hypothetical protein
MDWKRCCHLVDILARSVNSAMNDHPVSLSYFWNCCPSRCSAMESISEDSDID